MTSAPARKNDAAAAEITALAAGAGPPANTMPTRLKWRAGLGGGESELDTSNSAANLVRIVVIVRSPFQLLKDSDTRVDVCSAPHGSASPPRRPPIRPPTRLVCEPIVAHEIRGTVTHITAQGDLVSDIPCADLQALEGNTEVRVDVGEHFTQGIFAADHGEPQSTLIATLGSSGFLEIGIVGLSAQEMLGFAVGDAVNVRW
jgi:hypothetical protein